MWKSEKLREKNVEKLEKQSSSIRMTLIMVPRNSSMWSYLVLILSPVIVYSIYH